MDKVARALNQSLSGSPSSTLEENLATATHIDWKPEFSVGAEVIDQDHRILVELINQIAPALDSGEVHSVLGSVLHSLWDYTDYHFTREEKLQQLVNFPECVAHKAKHEALRSTVQQKLAAFAADPNSVDVGELLHFLRNWLMEHILKEDMRYKPFIENNLEAQAQVAEIRFADVLAEGDEDEEEDLFTKLSSAISEDAAEDSLEDEHPTPPAPY
ncbi:MAG: hypothetical protein A2516_04265 [Alphaproteobacteria bacterium RIFOXYD12_FULL_60_8]|nr:MAG: hypothetical protein A2516_04265 [Alphaproteobacteria bacterium RIFOXYD12_FULL_60_8]